MKNNVDKIVKDALDAIDGARTKAVAAGLMLAAAGLQNHKAVVHLRAVVGGLGCARDILKIDPRGEQLPPAAPEARTA